MELGPTQQQTCFSSGISLIHQQAHTSSRNTTAQQPVWPEHSLTGQKQPWTQLGPDPAHQNADTGFGTPQTPQPDVSGTMVRHHLWEPWALQLEPRTWLCLPVSQHSPRTWLYTPVVGHQPWYLLDLDSTHKWASSRFGVTHGCAASYLIILSHQAVLTGSIQGRVWQTTRLGAAKPTGTPTVVSPPQPSSPHRGYT